MLSKFEESSLEDLACAVETFAVIPDLAFGGFVVCVVIATLGTAVAGEEDVIVLVGALTAVEADQKWLGSVRAADRAHWSASHSR